MLCIFPPHTHTQNSKKEKTFEKRQDTCIVSNNFFKIFINDKKENSSFTMEQPGQHHLHQASKVNITGNRIYSCSSWYVFCDILAKMHNLNLIMRNFQINPSQIAFLKKWIILFKSVKIRKDKERLNAVRNGNRLRRHDSQMQCGILGWILQQKERPFVEKRVKSTWFS